MGRVRPGWSWRIGVFGVLGILAALVHAQRPAEAAGPDAAPRSTLTLLTTLQKENLRQFRDAFEAANPDIRLNIRSMSNGVITDALLGQEDVEGVDVVWGLSAASMILLRDEGLLLPHAPQDVGSILPAFRDGGDTPAWIGGGIWTSALCVTTRPGITAPVAWTDLTDPRWRGRIAMPSPLSTGGGFALMAGWIAQYGEDRAWAFMDALDENVRLYTNDSSKPCRMVATGALDVGLSFDFRAITLKEETGRVQPVFPEGLGWDISAAAIIRGTDAPAAARRFVDWSSAAGTRQMYLERLDFSLCAGGQVNRTLPDIPDDLVERLAPIDFDWLAENRERLLAEWLRRYGDKLELPSIP